jgi:lysophospholipase L1-like esterase
MSMIAPLSRKVLHLLAWLVLIWGSAETALQIRSHVRFGTSVLNALADDTTYVFNAQLGLKTLRPDAIIAGSRSTIETNALGLRGAPVPNDREEGELRVAILGASTVMGTYTRNNGDTLAAQLEEALNALYPGKSVRVINAGIAGASIDDQRLMLERLVIPRVDPDILVWYPGFNDVSGYCHRRSAPTTNNKPPIFSGLEIPTWLLTVELVTKNTVWARTVPAGRNDILNPRSLDLSQFGASVTALLDVVRRASLPTLVLTNARAFRHDMPESIQYALSETARYYNSCFDLAGLHEVYDLHNDMLVTLAARSGTATYRFDESMPGGEKNFGDATHFSVTGTRRAATLIVATLVSKGLLPGAPQEVQR